MANERPSETKQLATQGIILVAASFVVRFIGFLYRIPLTNLWGDAGNDAYSMAYQIYNLFIIISSFGVPAALSRMVGKRLALKQYANARQVFVVALVLIGSITLVCSLFMWFGAGFIANQVFGVADSMISIRVLAVTLLVVAGIAVLRGLFQGMNNMKPTAISQILEQFVNAAASLIFAFALFGKGLAWGVAGGISGAGFGGLAALVLLLFIYYLYRGRSWIGSKKAGSRYVTESNQQIAKEMMLLVIPIVLASAVLNIKNIVDSSLFLRLMRLKGYENEEISLMRGMYQGKFILLTTLPIAVGNALGTAAVPSITRSITLNDREEIRSKVMMQYRMIVLITLPAAIGMAIVASPMLHVLFPAAPDGASLFYVGSIQVVFYSIVHVSTGILQGLNRVKIPIVNAIIAALVALVVCIFCILLFNLNIYSLVISDIVFTFVLAYLDTDSVRRFTRFSVDWIEIFKKPLIATGAMGVCCLLVYLLVHRVEGSNIIALFLSIIVAVAVYFVVLVNIGGVTEEDMDNLPMGHKLELLRIPGLPSFDKKKKRRPVPRHVSRRPVHTDRNRRPRGKR